jgi:hypothetical protein
LIKNNGLTPPNARDDQPRTSVPQLSLRRSVNPPGRGPLHGRCAGLRWYLNRTEMAYRVRPATHPYSAPPSPAAVLTAAPHCPGLRRTSTGKYHRQRPVPACYFCCCANVHFTHARCALQCALQRALRCCSLRCWLPTAFTSDFCST